MSVTTSSLFYSKQENILLLEIVSKPENLHALKPGYGQLKKGERIRVLPVNIHTRNALRKAILE